MEYRVPNPFGYITVEEVPIKTKSEMKEVRCDIVIYDTETLMNEQVKDGAPTFEDQPSMQWIHKSQVKGQLWHSSFTC